MTCTLNTFGIFETALSAVGAVGVSWSVQLISFSISLGFGLLGGIPALLFIRKARPFERALTDFTAFILLIILFLVSVELGNKGAFAIYQLIAFLLGVPCIPVTLVMIKKKFEQKYNRSFLRKLFPPQKK